MNGTLGFVEISYLCSFSAHDKPLVYWKKRDNRNTAMAGGLRSRWVLLFWTSLPQHTLSRTGVSIARPPSGL